MRNELHITILPAFGDNYIYLAEYARGTCFAVDPGDAVVVQEALEQRGLALTHIFVTHGHGDHVGGVETLKLQTGCAVVGPDRRIAGVDTMAGDGDVIELGEVSIRCIATPGHTETSVCYHVTSKMFTHPALFTGDTLFVCGCGRVLGCGYETMYASLQKLTALPDETLIYPGHDYTEENVRFALTVEPDNEALQEKLAWAQKQIQTGHPTVPSTLAEEKRLNPFLQAKNRQTFATRRRKKDVF